VKYIRNYRELNEGNYHLKEVVQFNHKTNQAYVERKGQDGIIKEKYDIPHQVQDLVSGAYYLRSINFNKLKTKIPSIF
jgi:hypothetical protein